MKRILGLDLGSSSIGWALVNEAESKNERSSIVKLGVRVNPLTVDESINFEKGKSITTNADRTLKRSMRRNLHRYKLRREALIEVLKECKFITEDTILSENGNRTTFETYRLRVKALTEEISLEEFARVLIMINKKRGYKSSRKAGGAEEDTLIDGMDIARKLYDANLTPGELCLQLLSAGKKVLPDFYRSDLQNELDRIWEKQKEYYPGILTAALKEELRGKKRDAVWAICANAFVWKETYTEWNNEESKNEQIEKEHKLEGIYSKRKRDEAKKENLQWRVSGLKEKLSLEQLVIILQEINTQINNSSGYLGTISDRSKELYFNKQTVGQYLMDILDNNPNASLRNIVFYRQDYLDEFNVLWEKQAEFHKELTGELKKEIRDIIIFYQRRLKSQKGLISFCEFESRQIEVKIDGKRKIRTVGNRVIPRSSPLFQEFKIWQILNNIEVTAVGNKNKQRMQNGSNEPDDTEQLELNGRRYLYQEEKELLAKELFVRDKMTKLDVLRLLFDNPEELDLNFKTIDGNKTGYLFFQAYSKMIEMSGHEPVDFKKPIEKIVEQVKSVFVLLNWNTDILSFDSNKELDKQSYYKLCHLLYSFEGDNTPTGNGCLVQKIMDSYGLGKEFAKILANITFQEDYGSLSAKAIHKILPHLKEGNQYDVACEYAGYRHSKSSLTKEEIANKVLKDKLEVLPRNSLRNPVVEKILNQMVNVINAIIEAYGRPDEIRVELARELKKNAKEREKLTKSIAETTKTHEAHKKLLQEEFGLKNVGRSDILRYKLYKELESRGYKTLYSNTYIPREKLFSKEFDIEHIIPQARLFDDSFSNKTLEARNVNIEKGNRTAYDFVKEKFGESGTDNSLDCYLNNIEVLFVSGKISKTKYTKLKMTEQDIPGGFIERDLRNTQYIAKKALSMLNEISRCVVATSGSITDKLREDWQLVDVMKELNWEKYKALGLVEYFEDKDGKQIGRIKDWSKRNDHRHHAMDALTVAFTKEVFIQYFNNKNASLNPNTNEYAIKNKYFQNGRAIAPIPLNEFRAEAKKHLENTLISIKAKNKVITNNINKTKKRGGVNTKKQQTPRGQLHLETIYGCCRQYLTKEEKVNASFDVSKIATVSSSVYRDALLKRLQEHHNDPKKAFAGRNSLDKKPVWLDKEQIRKVPEKVKTVTFETIYTIRKEISPDLRVDKIIDSGVRKMLTGRLKEYGNDAKKAFSNLDEKPIWLNKEKGIPIKRVTISGISNAQSLHVKKDKDGKPVLDGNGRNIPVDFVNTGNNHHVAVYRRPVIDKNGQMVIDENGNLKYELEEVVVTFFDAVTRVNLGQPIIDKDYKASEGWQFLFSMKQNEYFVFPNKKTGFNPKEIDLLDADNYGLISPNLFRVQKFTHKNYVFRHHLETTIKDTSSILRGITWIDFRSSKGLDSIVKVRVNHIGQIVSVGEY